MSLAIYDNYGVCQEAKNFFYYLTNPPAGNNKKAYNAFITYLLRTGDFNKLDRLYIHGSFDQQGATVSLVNPSSAQATEVGGYTWNKFMGYKGNGTTMYLNSNFNLSTQGVNYTLNSASMFVYVRDEDNAASGEIGVFDGTSSGAWLSARYSDNKQYTRPNNGTSVGTAVSTSIGLSGWNRTASNAYTTYRDGIAIESNTTSSTSLVNANVYIGGIRTTADAVLLPSVKRIDLSGMGSGTVNQLNILNARAIFYQIAG